MYHLCDDLLSNGRDIREHVVDKYFLGETIYRLLNGRNLLDDFIAVSPCLTHLLNSFELANDPVDAFGQL